MSLVQQTIYASWVPAEEASQVLWMPSAVCSQQGNYSFEKKEDVT